jgi:DNA invertase Pin-like site-specific DNA recombinase
MKKPLAFAYVRFSSEKQSTGSSVDRQLQRAREYALEHGLELDDTTYHDLGVSAYRGKNAVEGKLGVFIAAVETGRIPRGSYLLVENFDRMSRNVVSEAQALLWNLVNRGITVVTLLDRQVFSKETIDSDTGPTQMILALLEMVRARNESKRKADLVTRGWENARKTKKIITRMAPAWLSTEDWKTWIIDRDRAEVVKRIFKMAHDMGLGTPTIARQLNAENVPTFGGAEGWSAGVVAHILKNKAVIGVLDTPKMTDEKYYPAIIKREVFDAVNTLLKQRNFAPGPRADGNIGNLFAGRSYCGVCGGDARMKSVSQHEKGLYLHCERAYSGKGSCDARRVAYHAFEKDILEHLIIAQHRNMLNLRDDVAIDPRVALMGALETKEKEIERAMDVLVSIGKSEAVMKRLKKLEAERDKIRDELRNAVPIPKTTEVLRDLLSTFQRYRQLEKEDRSGEEYRTLRRTLQVGLRNAVARIDFHHKPFDGREHYRVTFLSGTVRERTYERPAQGFQPGNRNGKR